MLTRVVPQKSLNRVTIKIMGDEYNVVGPESPEYINRLVETIESKVEAVQKAHGDAKLSKTQLAILVALQLTDELEKLRITHEKMEKLVQAAK
ncbi:MAG: cell division protein ZapA [Firmicutes bacterium]|nr:cell division protein ZapA [Bacillota bacterium]